MKMVLFSRRSLSIASFALSIATFSNTTAQAQRAIGGADAGGIRVVMVESPSDKSKLRVLQCTSELKTCTQFGEKLDYAKDEIKSLGSSLRQNYQDAKAGLSALAGVAGTVGGTAACGTVAASTVASAAFLLTVPAVLVCTPLIVAPVAFGIVGYWDGMETARGAKGLRHAYENPSTPVLKADILHAMRLDLDPNYLGKDSNSPYDRHSKILFNAKGESISQSPGAVAIQTTTQIAK